MINYEAADSPFFEANKKYCEGIVAKFKAMNLECSGFCNSFGYDIETSLKKGNLNYHFKFEKHQSTRGGGIVPINAHNYAGSAVTVTGLNKKFNVTIDKSKLIRLFSSRNLNKKIPSPYYMKFNYTPDDSFVDELSGKVTKDKIDKFRLSNGKLEWVMHSLKEDPSALIADIETTIKSWE